MNSCGHFALNLTGAAQSLASAFVDPKDPRATGPITWLSIQSLAANSNLVYIGFAGDVLSSSNYAMRIEIPVTGIPAAPLIIEGQIISLDKVFVLGTLNEDITVGYIRS